MCVLWFQHIRTLSLLLRYFAIHGQFGTQIIVLLWDKLGSLLTSIESLFQVSSVCDYLVYPIPALPNCNCRKRMWALESPQYDCSKLWQREKNKKMEFFPQHFWATGSLITEKYSIPRNVPVLKTLGSFRLPQGPVLGCDMREWMEQWNQEISHSLAYLVFTFWCSEHNQKMYLGSISMPRAFPPEFLILKHV